MPRSLFDTISCYYEFVMKTGSQLKRTPFKQSPSLRVPLKRSKLRLQGVSTPAQTKQRIQAKLRDIVILRDGGCILRVVLGSCPGPLQAEHLISRTNSATFADTRNIVCLCQYHHIFWKPQHSRLYWELIEQHVGPTIWNWIKLAEADKSPYKIDWKLSEIVLDAEYKLLSSQ